MAKENTDISQLITEAKKGNLTAQLTLAGIYEEGLAEIIECCLAIEASDVIAAQTTENAISVFKLDKHRQ